MASSAILGLRIDRQSLVAHSNQSSVIFYPGRKKPEFRSLLPIATNLLCRNESWNLIGCYGLEQFLIPDAHRRVSHVRANMTNKVLYK